MSEQEKEQMLDLLADRAVFGLTPDELKELEELEKNFPELRNESESFELSAAQLGIVNLDASEPLPAHLEAKILASADSYFAARETPAPAAPAAEKEEFQKTFTVEPKTSIWQWLGWAAAAAACIALAVNLWTTRVGGPQIVQNPTPTPTAAPPAILTPAQQREQLIASATDAVQSSWTDFDPKKNAFNVQGDVVWSNSAQKGFLRFRGLPVNDKNQETYQVWIFDKAQKNPISGGVFDIDANGEVVVPIDSAIRVQSPTMFGITAEKPGGVMVSDLKKVMAVAKLSA